MAADEIGPLGPISAWFKPVADQMLVLSRDLKVLRVADAEKVIGRRWLAENQRDFEMLLTGMGGRDNQWQFLFPFLPQTQIRLIKRIDPVACLSLKTVSVWLAALAFLVVAPVGAVPITYDMVTVGNAGNANDTGGSGIGGVAYDYQIGKYDVTIGQYAAFLNAADPSGANLNDIWYDLMQDDLNIAGISYDALASNGSKYSVVGPYGNAYGQTGANRPITYVSWFSAARFANWMANGKGSGSTENGAYNLVAAPAGTAPAKNFINPYTGAAPTFYIPNENEWYKAAYYSPDYGGARAGGYYAYATQSNTDPGNVVGSDANQANYHNGVFSVTQSVIHDSSQNYLTDVGAFTNSASFYGTFDQTGNVFQWNDLDGTAGSSRGLRGGTWGSDDPFIMSSSFSLPHDPLYGSAGFGFRLASPVTTGVPEIDLVATGVPEIDLNGLSAVLGLIVGGLGLLERRRYGR